ncbi:putative uncharacterized protein DDB_G0282133 [Belonocnema kinseyi]|uniref:putative uncharacterized protein DDB_G0282133 n=1 Tax=Belonocnema kinseyi TaxID=2817044 RepID=UPI00143CE380|nr:putative uncharacterized protein DDB_G0282133 [Belonocnema kinseyi]
MRLLTSTVFLLPFLAFSGVISSEDGLQSTTSVWPSEQEINITHELVGESIVKSTTERSDVPTAESDLNNMSQKNTTENDSSKDNITKLIVENDSVLENDTGNKYISKNDGKNTDQGTTESTSFDLERTTTVTNVLINQETTIVPPKDISLEDSSNVQNSGQMVNKTKDESTPTEDSISPNDQSSSKSRNSTPRIGRNGNDHKGRLQPLPLSYKNKQRSIGHQKSLINDYLFSDKSKSIDFFGILKLILEKETLELDSKILDFMQSTSSDKSVSWNTIYNIIAFCLKSKGLSSRPHALPRNWYNQPITLLQPDVLPKAAFAEYLVSVEQPIESTWLPVGSNIDTPMLDTRDRKAFETSLIDIYESEANPLTEMASNTPSRIDHLRPCWKTQRNCFPLGDKTLCKNKVICKSPEIEDKGSVKKSGVYNLHNTISNLENGIPNLESGILSLKSSIPFLKNLIPFLKNNIPLLQNFIPNLENAPLVRKDERYKNVGYKDEMDRVEVKVLSDDISQADRAKPGILTSNGSTTEITSGTIAALPTNDSSPSYVNPIKGSNPMFDTNTIDDATRRFSTSKPENTNLTVSLNSASENLNSLNKLLNNPNNLNNLNTLSSFINAGSTSAKGDHADSVEGNKDESAGSKESVQRAFTSEPITGGSDTLPTLSVSTKPLSVSMNQSVLNEITPTSKTAEPVESGPVATAKRSETIFPSVSQMVSLSSQSNEGSVSDNEANSHRASAANSLVNQKYPLANFEKKMGNINTNLDRIVNTNLNSDLNINAISKINNVLNAARINSSGISANNSLEGIRQSLKTKPKSSNSQHVRMNLNQDSNVNINQDENVSKLERGSIEQPMQEPIKMQLPVSSQTEHQSPLPRNTGIAGWNAKQDGSLNENRNPNTNVNQNVNTNQGNIAGLTRGVNPMLASSGMSVNSSNDINRLISDGDLNMFGNLGLSRRTNSGVGFKGQQISHGPTLAQDVSVVDAVSANTNLNYNSKVNSDYNANLRQGDSLKMSKSIRDIPTPTQSSEPVAVVRKGGKINVNPHNNDGVDSNFKAHANFKLNLGSGFGIIKNMLSKNPILSGGIISRRIMNLSPKDQNLQVNVANQDQNENKNLNVNQNQNLNENQNPYHSQIQSAKQIQNSKEYLNQNLNQNRYANLDQNGNQHESVGHVPLNQKENQTQNQKPNEKQGQNAINYQNQNSNPYANQNLNQIDIQSQNLILNQLRNQDQFQRQSQHNQDHSSNQSLNRELNLQMNSNLNQNQFKDQIQNQNQVYSQNGNQYDQLQNQDQVQIQISNQYLSQNKNANKNQNQNLNDNGYQNQNQYQNQIKQQNTNEYLSQKQNQNFNMREDEHSNQNLNEDQIQNQYQFHNLNANQYLNQNQNVNLNLHQDLNENLNTKQNLISNDSDDHNHVQTQNQINQQNNLIQDLSQNLNQNLKKTQGLNQNHKQYQNEIQIQSQSKNEIEHQHFSQNKDQKVKPIINENQNLNQIQNLNVKQDPRRYLNMNQNMGLNRHQKQVQNQIQRQNSNEHKNSNQYQNQNENQFLNKVQTQYLKQDLMQNFTQNHNSNQNHVQNVNQNHIQTSDVNSPDKSEEKKKGWYELWFNEGEGKDDWIEVWNNKTFKRFRRETNHYFY